jgi:hypothetical protein
MKTEIKTKFEKWIKEYAGIQNADIFSEGSLVKNAAIAFAEYCIEEQPKTEQPVSAEIFTSALDFLKDKNIPSAVDRGYIARWMQEFYASQSHPIDLRKELYFAFMKEYNALQGKNVILNEEVESLLSRHNTESRLESKTEKGCSFDEEETKM